MTGRATSFQICRGFRNGCFVAVSGFNNGGISGKVANPESVVLHSAKVQQALVVPVIPSVKSQESVSDILYYQNLGKSSSRGAHRRGCPKQRTESSVSYSKWMGYDAFGDSNTQWLNYGDNASYVRSIELVSPMWRTTHPVSSSCTRKLMLLYQKRYLLSDVISTFAVLKWNELCHWNFGARCEARFPTIFRRPWLMRKNQCWTLLMTKLCLRTTEIIEELTKFQCPRNVSILSASPSRLLNLAPASGETRNFLILSAKS